MEIVLAHAGHWAIYVLYAVPVIVVLATIVVTARRERQADAAGRGDATPPDS